jgi:HEAT repeat protein
LVRNNPSGEGSVSAWALGQIAKGPDEVIPVLITGLQSPDGGLRRGCADALGRFGQQAQSAAPALLGALQDNDPAVSRAAAESLTQINSEAPKQGEEK